MEPFEQAYNHQHEILPMDIIEKMAEFPVDPEQVITMKGVRSTLMHKVVDLEFVRFSNTHMFGTVKGHGPEKIRREGDLEAAFLAFFYYRDKFPDRRNDARQENQARKYSPFPVIQPKSALQKLLHDLSAPPRYNQRGYIQL